MLLCGFITAHRPFKYLSDNATTNYCLLFSCQSSCKNIATDSQFIKIPAGRVVSTEPTLCSVLVAAIVVPDINEILGI